MKTIADLHMHTLVSQHAYSTVDEMIRSAKQRELEAIAVTDHGPSMPDGAIPLHFLCLRGLPETVDGVRLYKGIETNITSYAGVIDLEKNILEQLDFIIASYHIECITPSSRKNHTEGLVRAAENPLVDCLGHPGNPVFACDCEPVVKACARSGTLIEINSASFRVRRGSEENCARFAQLCAENGVPVVVNSDAHSAYSVGDHQAALAMLESIGFPEELVINSSKERLAAWFAKRRRS